MVSGKWARPKKEEQSEIACLRQGNKWFQEENEILKKLRYSLRSNWREIRIHSCPSQRIQNHEVERLCHAINALRAQITWRRTDLNPASPSYQSHFVRIALLTAALAKLEEAYRNICGGECPA